MAEWLIRNYISPQAVGEHGHLTAAYAVSDVARTEAHSRRFFYLRNNTEHVLLGAVVPFFDIARVCGGACLMLADRHTELDPTATLVASRRLQIIGGLRGAETPELGEQLGEVYVAPEHFQLEEDGEPNFTDEAMVVVRSLLSKHGCPTAKIKTESGNLFGQYWEKINRLLLTNVDHDEMRAEIVGDSQ